MSVQDQLLTLLLNSKKGEDLPVINSLTNTGKLIVFDPNTNLISAILKENLTISTSGGNSIKIKLTVDFNGKANYTISSKPDNIDLIFNRVEQDQGVDYTYDNQSGALTIINQSVISSIKTTSSLYVRTYSNSLSKKQKLIIPSSGHATYNLSEKPKNIDLLLNRTPLNPDTDFTYDSQTGDILIINNSYANSITLNSILLARKYY